jgi:hypothetical protein
VPAVEGVDAHDLHGLEDGFATILLVNGLGLMPVAWYGSEEQKRKWIGAAKPVEIFFSWNFRN